MKPTILLPLFLTMLALTACPPTGGDPDPDPDCSEPAPSREFFLNDDGDGYGDESVWLCADPFEVRPDNYSPFDGDCDDDDDAVHPDADEMCDGIDNDCDGAVDVNAIDAIAWHEDNDGDGYGNPLNGPVQCSAPDGYVADNSDCDDSSAQIYPGAQGCE